jgi:hypothetical protein
MNIGKYGEKINPYTLPGRVDGGGGHCFRLVALGNKEEEQQQPPAGGGGWPYPTSCLSVGVITAHPLTHGNGGPLSPQRVAAKIQKKIIMHQPGIEPGSVPWQGTILPLDHWCLRCPRLKGR